jgi:hypothetical protein
VLVEGVDGDLGAAADDLGLELGLGGRADLAVEDDLDGVRAAEVEVVGHEGVEEGAGVAGLCKQDLDPLEEHRVDMEQVAGEDPRGLRLQELAPRWFAVPGRGNWKKRPRMR